MASVFDTELVGIPMLAAVTGSPNGGVMEEISLKGVSEIQGTAKKEAEKQESLGFLDIDEDKYRSVKCALKIEVVDDTALIGPATLALNNHSGGNTKRPVVMMQENDDGKRIAESGGSSKDNGNDKTYVVQESDGNGRSTARNGENCLNNGKEKGTFAQEMKGDEKKMSSSNGNLKKNVSDENGERIAGCDGTLNVNAMEEGEEKRGKKPRRRGKKSEGKKKVDGIENDWTLPLVGAVKVGALPVCREGRLAYSRKEMEALRFLDVEEQKKKWVEVYCGLGAEIAMEYDGLVDSDRQKQKHIKLDFDPRRQFGFQRPPLMFGESCSQNEKNVSGDVNSLDSDNSLPIHDESSCLISEAECSYDGDDTDDEYDNILRPAFFVAGEPDFDSGPPQDGLEFLRRVRWEAAQMPKVKVAKVDRSKLNKEQTAYMPTIPDIAKCPDHLLPSKEWEDAFLADFSKLRLALSEHEFSTHNLNSKQSTVHERQPSLKLSTTIFNESFEGVTAEEDCFPYTDVAILDNTVDQQRSVVCESDVSDSLESSSRRPAVKEENEDRGNYPTLSIILGMDSVCRASALRKRISSLENMCSLAKDYCLWIFALCAAIDTPLDADTSASFRSLLRKCAGLRAQRAELDEEVIMLNILAAISGRYFGQSEN